MHRILLALAFTWFACGPMVTDVASDSAANSGSNDHDDQGCLACAREVCDGLIDACRNSSECSCIAECLDTAQETTQDGADPFYGCADYCGRLEVQTWRDISECASELCNMCPPADSG